MTVPNTLAEGSVMPITTELAGNRTTTDPAEDERALKPALRRGAAGCCPACGEGKLYASYLKVVDTCANCGEALHHQRADDAPAYFTMAIVGHIVVGGLLAVERAYAPPTWVQLSIWLPLTLVLSLALLPAIKGSLIAVQWAYRMHGFGSAADPAAPMIDPAQAALKGDERRHS